jgi:ATP-dependent phosphoenolpyruvate carboxykinase
MTNELKNINFNDLFILNTDSETYDFNAYLARQKHPIFGFEVPSDVSGVDKKFLDFPSGRAVEDLAEKFKTNIHKFKNFSS